MDRRAITAGDLIEPAPPMDLTQAPVRHDEDEGMDAEAGTGVCPPGVFPDPGVPECLCDEPDAGAGATEGALSRLLFKPAFSRFLSSISLKTAATTIFTLYDLNLAPKLIIAVASTVILTSPL